MLWIALGLLLLLVPLLFVWSWRRAAADLGAGPAPRLWRAVPAVAVAGGALYGSLGLHPETATWLEQWREHRDTAASLLEGRPGPDAEQVPVPVLTRVLQRAVAARPTAEGWYGLGLLYAELEAAEQAVLAARRAVEMAPRELAPRFLLARSLIRQADGRLVPEARTLLDGILEREPQHDGAWMMLGMAAMESGEYDLAIEAWDSLLSRHGDDAAAEPLRTARARAVELKKNRAWVAGLTVTVDAPAEVAPGGTLFVFVRRAGAAGQPLAAVRVLADRFPREVPVGPADWLQAIPEPGTPLVAGARYSPGPGGAVADAAIVAENRVLERGSGGLRASLELRRGP